MEFKGNSGNVTLDGDHLVLNRKGFGSDFMGWKDRRIPIAAVREIVWQDAGKLSRLGYIHFVLGNSPVPAKTGYLSMVGKPETFDFKAGRQAKAFAELRDHVQRLIDQNRAAGVDPATIRYLSAEENATQSAQRELAEMDDKMFGGKIVTHAEMGEATNAEMIAKLRQHPDLAAFHTLAALLANLRADEAIEVAAVGDVAVALTNERVIAVLDEMGKSRFEELPLAQITSVSWDSRILHSGMTFHGPGKEIKVKAVSQGMAQRFIDTTRALQDKSNDAVFAGEVRAPSSGDVLDAIRKLGDLRDSGVLTEDEFATKKAELLGRL